MATSIVLGFGADWSIVAGSQSQRKQGSLAFLRSASLTVNGKPISGTAQTKGFRLNVEQARAVTKAGLAVGKAGKVTLPMVKRGRPTGANIGMSGLAAMLAPTASKAPRKTRAAKVATSATEGTATV